MCKMQASVQCMRAFIKQARIRMCKRGKVPAPVAWDGRAWRGVAWQGVAWRANLPAACLPACLLACRLLGERAWNQGCTQGRAHPGLHHCQLGGSSLECTLQVMHASWHAHAGTSHARKGSHHPCMQPHGQARERAGAPVVWHAGRGVAWQGRAWRGVQACQPASPPACQPACLPADLLGGSTRGKMPRRP